MKIYKGEEKLADLIIAENKICYNSQLVASPAFSVAAENTDTPDTEDLFYTKSILVSTVWNKNDDIFLPEEVWAARKTPVDKPTNLGHDHNQIVGHITSQWVIDAAGNIVDEDAGMPDFFHVCNGAVIYKRLPRRDPELSEAVEETIQQIQNNEKFVSMECFFTGFDYALSNEKEEYELIARSDETAFLSKYLRSYGGDGVYNNQKIGRVLRNIIFAGKGYVDKPANPDSIIFSFSGLDIDFKESGVYNSRITTVISEENSNMSLELVEKQLSEVKAQLDKQLSLNEELKGKLAEANVEKFQNEIQELKAQVETLQSDNTAAAEKIENLEALKAEQAEKVEALSAEKTSLEETLAEMKKDVTKAGRVTKLVDAGVDKDTAVAKVEKFIALSDEQFDDVAETIIDLVKARMMGEDEKDKAGKGSKIPDLRQVMSEEDEDAGSDNADSSVLDNVDPEPESVNAGAIDSGNELSDREQALAALTEFVQEKFGKKEKSNA